MMNSDFIVAVHAMIFLYHKGEGNTISSEALAENICTNPARVRRIMAKMKKAELVLTKEGRTAGGYSYPPNRHITLGDISAALGVSFANFNWRSGDKEKACLISSGMSDYIDKLQGELNRQCHNYLATVSIDQAEKELTLSLGKETL